MVFLIWAEKAEAFYLCSGHGLIASEEISESRGDPGLQPFWRRGSGLALGWLLGDNTPGLGQTPGRLQENGPRESPISQMFA